MKQILLRSVREVLEAKAMGLKVEHRDTRVSLDWQPLINIAKLYQYSSIEYHFNINEQYRLA